MLDRYKIKNDIATLNRFINIFNVYNVINKWNIDGYITKQASVISSNGHCNSKLYLLVKGCLERFIKKEYPDKEITVKTENKNIIIKFALKQMESFPKVILYQREFFPNWDSYNTPIINRILMKSYFIDYNHSYFALRYSLTPARQYNYLNINVGKLPSQEFIKNSIESIKAKFYCIDAYSKILEKNINCNYYNLYPSDISSFIDMLSQCVAWTSRDGFNISSFFNTIKASSEKMKYFLNKGFVSINIPLFDFFFFIRNRIYSAVLREHLTFSSVYRSERANDFNIKNKDSFVYGNTDTSKNLLLTYKHFYCYMHDKEDADIPDNILIIDWIKFICDIYLYCKNSYAENDEEFMFENLFVEDLIKNDLYKYYEEGINE